MRSAQSRPENQASTYQSPSPSSSSSRTVQSAPGRMIVGLMFFGVTFALVSNEIAPKTSSSPVNEVTEGGKIIIGGIAATVALVLLSHAGEQGAQFATGLALITAVTSVLVKGGPVWASLSKVVGTKPIVPTTATTPTTGTKTVTSIAQAA
jgi:hypothetical protein